MSAKLVMGGVFNFVVGFVLSVVSTYHLTDWQLWAAALAIIVTGFIFAHMKD